MSFLFGRAKSRATADLPKQARESILKLDGPNGSAKVQQLLFSSANTLASNLNRRERNFPES